MGETEQEWVKAVVNIQQALRTVTQILEAFNNELARHGTEVKALKEQQVSLQKEVKGAFEATEKRLTGIQRLYCKHKWVETSCPTENQSGWHTECCKQCGEVRGYDTSD